MMECDKTILQSLTLKMEGRLKQSLRGKIVNYARNVQKLVYRSMMWPVSVFSHHRVSLERVNLQLSSPWTPN